MLRLTSLTLALLTLLVAAAPARAQSSPQPWMPQPAPMGDRLIQRGHKLKVAGAIMMGFGSALLVTSIALNVTDSVNLGSSHQCDQYFAPSCSDGTLRGPLWGGSMITFATGVPLLFGGIATYVVGGVQMAKGERLRLSGFAAAPLVGPSGVDGAAASASFRF
jgi:hypothetical protein